ncbi:transcription-repair coupling factor [Intestinibacillus massiliensis]|uniref:transcription-repair coupling factor n=1 Tax=Intestinibacillus massiliensis TaxID=1871029 RepID=UPI000B34BC78|nr:transcription-repair coupling factor [Intestinibacillus massiliensis]
MNEIALSITNLREYNAVYDALRRGDTPVASAGLSPIHKAHLAAALHLETSRPVFVLTADDQAAARMARDLSAFLERDVLTLPYRDFVMLGALGSSREFEHKRLAALHRMRMGAPAVVASVAAAAEACIPPGRLAAATLTLKAGEEYDLLRLAADLSRAGYARAVQVEGPGQFAVRGDLLDLFPPQERAPVRCEFFGDELDTMSYFDVGSQRRGDRLDTLLCLPCAEALPHLAPGGVPGLVETLQKTLAGRRKKHPDLDKNLRRDIERLTEDGTLPGADKYLPLIYPERTCALAYLPEDVLFLVDDTPRVREASRGFAARMADDVEALLERGELSGEHTGFALGFPQIVENFKRYGCVLMDTFLSSVPEVALGAIVNFTANQMNAYGGNVDMAAADISLYAGQGRRVVMLCASPLRCKNMEETLRDAGVPCALSDKLPAEGRVHIMEGGLSAGFEYPALGLAVMTEGQVLSRRQAGKTRKKSNRDRVKSYTDLTPGDLVVHEHHGIGRFVGMERMTVDGAQRDFVKIAFAGTDFLYVPATNLDLISKYIGGGGDPEKTRLNKLGGADWARARTRAKAAAKELAAGLIQLYAERNRLKGYAFPADDDWQREFEASFPYDETDDQLKCIEEIKADMQSARPMDRLLCGDVGFGKTEVALRAIMKCVLAGKQAAILVPTTVLARQHYLTALDRFSGFPMTIELLSRYKTPSEQKKILEKLQTGMIDLIVGTHKLFRKDLKFKDLGLLVVDEEQRFGVSHKEKLKEISKQVDVLTLSATPIPRTLNMALSGIRDMSVIEQPPHDRHPVQTFVIEFSEPVVNDAMRRELARGGQVYYLHNRVESIDRTANRIQKAFPDARIGVAHGKMTQRELANIMTQMSDGEIDILVCTTIIETGIDIPNANTLVIENADAMGLAQLHQIRGRVGRSSRHAFAYLTFRAGKVLSEISQKRLSAVREFAEFGSGFKIAMRDLEIRGAGNVLGPEQSGHMMSVGYDLYLKLLEEAVLEERGKTPKRRVECAAELTLSANIPTDYVADAGQRVDLYRRIALIRNAEQREDMLDELIDRFGDPPAPVAALCDIALLRAQASDQGIVEIRQTEGRLLLTWESADFARLSALCAEKAYKGRLLLNAGSQPYISLRLNKGEAPMEMAQKLVALYAATGTQKEDG